MKKPKIPIDVLLEECIKAMKIEIRKEFHYEAKEILMLASDNDRKEFLNYHKKNNGNICCLVLDKIKRNLIIDGKMSLNDGDGFGKPVE